MLSTAAITQIYSSYKATFTYGVDFLGGTSCSHTQESFDSDDEDTAVSFNNPTGQKMGLQAHTAQSTAAACTMAQPG